MIPTLVDSNVILDVLTQDRDWLSWSSAAFAHAADTTRLVINPVIYSEVSVHFSSIEELDAALPADLTREPIPFEAAFLAGKAFLKYRRAGGLRVPPLPDFFIGAHAAVTASRILTRDVERYSTYFPTVSLLAP